MSCFNNSLKNIFFKKSNSKSQKTFSTKFFLINLFAFVLVTSNSYAVTTGSVAEKTKITKANKSHKLSKADKNKVSEVSVNPVQHPADLELTRTLSAVGTGPYFGIGSEYDGSDLVVLQPNIHKDLALLKQQQRMAKYAGHTNGPTNPYVQLSGYLESQFIAQSKNNNKINLTASNLDISAWVNRYMSAYTNFGVDTDDANDQFFRMIMGFITLGNLNESPYYMSVGQMFIPFGSFSTSTSYIGTIPRGMGRIQEQAVSVGYYKENGLHVTGAIYDGKTKDSGHFTNRFRDHTSHKRVDQYAGTVAYQSPFKLYDLPSSSRSGISYTNNIADALVTRNVFNRAGLHHYVSGIDIFNKTNVGPFVVKTEYVTALEHYSKQDITIGGKSARPGSFLGELEYDTLVYGKGTAFVFHYSRIYKGSMTSVIKHQTGFNVTMNVLKDTVVSFEYARRGAYSDHYVLSNTSTITPNALNTRAAQGLNLIMDGKTRDLFVLTLDLFF